MAIGKVKDAAPERMSVSDTLDALEKAKAAAEDLVLRAARVSQLTATAKAKCSQLVADRITLLRAGNDPNRLAALLGGSASVPSADDARARAEALAQQDVLIADAERDVNLLLGEEHVLGTQMQAASTAVQDAHFALLCALEAYAVERYQAAACEFVADGVYPLKVVSERVIEHGRGRRYAALDTPLLLSQLQIAGPAVPGAATLPAPSLVPGERSDVATWVRNGVLLRSNLPLDLQSACTENRDALIVQLAQEATGRKSNALIDQTK